MIITNNKHLVSKFANAFSSRCVEIAFFFFFSRKVKVKGFDGEDYASASPLPSSNDI